MNKIVTFLFISIWTISCGQSYTVEELRKKLKPGNYNGDIVLEFQRSMEHLEEKPDIYEYVPGEVIAWSLMDGGFLLSRMFLAKNGTLREIEALPTGDAFLSKLNSHVPEKSRFVYRDELWTLPAVKEKLADNSYLIAVDVKSYNPRPYEPSPDVLTYNLEYTTKDFVDFRLIRLKDARSEEWIEAGRY